MLQPDLPTDTPLRLSKGHMDFLAAKLQEWLVHIDHVDPKTGKVLLTHESAKELKIQVNHFINKFQTLEVMTFWPHYY
jgi:Cu/Ag efflux protein CusF